MRCLVCRRPHNTYSVPTPHHIWPYWTLTRRYDNTLFHRTYSVLFASPKRTDHGHWTRSAPCNNTVSSVNANRVGPHSCRLLHDSHRSFYPDLLYIHRSYFAQAIRQQSDDPLKHRYAQSVLATYRSACRIISSLWGLYEVHKGDATNCWFFWSSVFSACVSWNLALSLGLTIYPTHIFYR